MKCQHNWIFTGETLYTNPGEPQELVKRFTCVDCEEIKEIGWKKNEQGRR